VGYLDVAAEVSSGGKLSDLCR